jgi:hypothetical protein
VTDETEPEDDDRTKRYVRREQKLEAEKERQKKHGRSLLELDRLAAKRAAELEKKKSARKRPAKKSRRR